MKASRKRARLFCILSILALLPCIAARAQQPASPQKIRILCLARPLPVIIAESRGILAKYGIEAEFLVRPSSESLRSDLAAYVEGQRILRAPANKQQVVELVMKESKLPEPVASDWYAAMVQSGGYAKDAAFDVQGFKKTLQLRAEVEAGGNGNAPAAEKYYDLSYYRAALEKLK